MEVVFGGLGVLVGGFVQGPVDCVQLALVQLVRSGESSSEVGSGSSSEVGSGGFR